VIEAYVSERRNAAAARAFVEQAIRETDIRPQRVTTDKAGCYPPRCVPTSQRPSIARPGT
jgi:transposase-like protein